MTLFWIRMLSLNPVKIPQVPFWSQLLFWMMTPVLTTERMPARGVPTTLKPWIVM